jgi:hypothetical protein
VPDNEGPEPEGVAIARIGGIMVYDITDPCASRVIARLSSG